MSNIPQDDDYLPFVYAGPVAAASAVLPLVASLLLAVRLYNRVNQKQAVAVDDWLLIAATLCCWAMGAILLQGIRRHLVGYAEPPLQPGYNQLKDLVPGQAELDRLEYVFWIMMILTFGLIKLSVLFFYRRLFAVNRSFNIITWAAIGVSVLWTVGFFFAQVFFCGAEPWHYWSAFADSSAHCGKGLYFLVSLAATDLATDCFIFFLPLPIIWRLHMAQKRKIMTSLVFLLGSISLIASAFRLSIHIDHLNAGYAKPADVYLTFTMSFYWSMLEAGIALVAVNLPTLGHFSGMSSVQSMVRSARSALSLRTLSSHSSQKAERVGSTADTTTRQASVEPPMPSLPRDELSVEKVGKER